eukprot:8769445-Pyramimonas_sp.AAC.1
MRSRLWKCSSEQVREASSAESRGAEVLFDPPIRELIREAQNGHHRAGVDVSSEGAPPDEAWSEPLSRDQDSSGGPAPCLLYTSDAADDTPCVDL